MFLGMFKNDWKKYWPADANNDTALLTTCSHAKPYAKSFIHQTIRKSLHEIGKLDTVDICHISAAGTIVSKRGFEYPYNAYDGDYSNASNELRAELTAKIYYDLSWWRDNVSHLYTKIVVYLREGSSSIKAATAAFEGLKKVKIIPVTPETVPFALENDPDDCLTLDKNLYRLQQLIK